METHPSAGLAVNSGACRFYLLQKLSPGILCHWHCPMFPGSLCARTHVSPTPESQQRISEPGAREQQGCLCVCVCVLAHACKLGGG